MLQRSFICVVGCLAIVALGVPRLARAAEIVVRPEVVKIEVDRGQQLVVSRVDSVGAAPEPTDLTHVATYRVEAAELLSVSPTGVLQGLKPGTTFVVIQVEGVEVRVPIEVSPAPTTIDFDRDLQPILTRLACNSGPCHGKQRGQNGFQLSLLGFDSDFDHDAMTKEDRGRRIAFSSPTESLLLRKPTGQVPHGGGVRLKLDSVEYQTLLHWIEAGAPRSVPGTSPLDHISIWPTARVMNRGERQQLLVNAHYKDGSTRDVTAAAMFQSNEAAIAAVDQAGVVTAGTITGEVAVMGRYLGNFAVCRASVPLPGEVPADFYASLPRTNYIDGHVWDTLQRLRLTPSAAAPDEKFLRRVYVDIIGRLPTSTEAREFLQDQTTDKRTQLVDRLLEDPEYAEHWANKWADLLRPNPYHVGIKATVVYDGWIRDSFRRNKPYDQLVRELLTARGGTFKHGNVTMFRDRREPEELTTIVSQLFLGIRLECAKCHHHPFEVWSQDDFYSFAAFFGRVGRKGTGISAPISGSEEFVFAGQYGHVAHPRTAAVMAPKVLFGTTPEIVEGSDRREVLANWIANAENPFFARTMSNRVWLDLMGVGLVEPVDDLRATNPPSNAPLLAALGDDFRDSGFNIKHLIRSITTSYVYGLSSQPTERNTVDTRNYSRHYRQRLRGEVLLDSVSQITGIPDTLDAMPPDSKSKQLWTHRVESLFLDAFGRPDPNQDPPCERNTDTTLVQALHVMNSDTVYHKLTQDAGVCAQLAQSDKTPPLIVEELYLSTYSRLPTAAELAVGVGLFEKPEANRRHATEDLLWALLNTPEFWFKD